MASVQFFTEKISFKVPRPRKTIQWLKQVCLAEGKPLGSLTYVFCSDAYLRTLNKKFLNHSTLTDILSFPSGDSSAVDGEIYISIPRIKENSKIYAQPFERELRRVMVHGLLHFMGYGDKTASEKAKMREKEEAYLSL